MEFDIRDTGNEITASLSGQLGFQDNGDFRRLVAGLDDDGKALVLDLTGLDFIDSAGLGMLLVLKESHERAVRLRTAPGQVARLLELARFSDFFSIETFP